MRVAEEHAGQIAIIVHVDGGGACTHSMPERCDASVLIYELRLLAMNLELTIQKRKKEKS